jgi:hypothetical protein
MLVQPATVTRCHRRGCHGWWRARSRRRPGRPRIESDVRDLIRRMSTENRLWGAPRLHGELLKLGIAVSERTVSRYLPDRTRGGSQTWRTFLANHVGDLMCSSAVASSERPGDDVLDTGLFSFCVTPRTAGRLQLHGDYRWRSFGSTPVPSLAGFLGPTLTTGHGQLSSGRDPASHYGRDWPHAYARRFFRPSVPLRAGGTDRLRRPVRHASWIAIGEFGDSPCAASSINLAAGLTRRARSARPRAFLYVTEFWRGTGTARSGTAAVLGQSRRRVVTKHECRLKHLGRTLKRVCTG